MSPMDRPNGICSPLSSDGEYQEFGEGVCLVIEGPNIIRNRMSSELYVNYLTSYDVILTSSGNALHLY